MTAWLLVGGVVSALLALYGLVVLVARALPVDGARQR